MSLYSKQAIHAYIVMNAWNPPPLLPLPYRLPPSPPPTQTSHVLPAASLPDSHSKVQGKKFGSGGIRTRASEETGALNQRLRPLGHATSSRARANNVR